jgi:hypothetical protein
MIGGIQVFLPHSIGEAEIFVAHAATEVGQLVETVKEEL